MADAPETTAWPMSTAGSATAKPPLCAKCGQQTDSHTIWTEHKPYHLACAPRGWSPLHAKDDEIERLRALLADVMAPIEAGALMDTAAGKNFRDSRTAAAIKEELARAR